MERSSREAAVPSWRLGRRDFRQATALCLSGEIIAIGLCLRAHPLQDKRKRKIRANLKRTRGHDRECVGEQRQSLQA